jgi:transcriptional regulator with XRE-family HTH domain
MGTYYIENYRSEIRSFLDKWHYPYSRLARVSGVGRATMYRLLHINDHPVSLKTLRAIYQGMTIIENEMEEEFARRLTQPKTPASIADDSFEIQKPPTQENTNDEVYESQGSAGGLKGRILRSAGFGQSTAIDGSGAHPRQMETDGDIENG